MDMDKQLRAYLELRVVVGYLGEKAQFGWWPTEFYSSASQMFLEPAFPKSVGLAQYHGVREAARRVHDEHIGVGRVFHLFRLPEEAEQDLHRHLQNNPGSVPHPAGRQGALEELMRIAGGPGEAPEGPIAVGKSGAYLTAVAVAAVASAYLGAFSGTFKTYPYFKD